jgi:quercetin dioxygenase-like cupin family protein
MAHAGQEFEGPNGMRLRLVSIDPEQLEMEAHYSGEGPLPPAHLHAKQDERFTVLDGAVRTVIDGHERRYVAGESFGVPAGTVHQMSGDGPARVKWEVSPALRTAEFFEELYTGAAAEDPAAFLARYEDEFRLA